VRVAIVDTGVDFLHPHVGRPPRGCAVRAEGEGAVVTDGDCSDVAGHGTCVAALVLWHAPEAEIDAIRAVGADLRARGADLAAAIETAVERGARIVNVSVGTHDARVRERMVRAVGAATARAVRVVAAAPEGARDVLPAGLPGVLAVGAAASGSASVVHRPSGFPPLLAPAGARPFEGQRSNFRGPSLAAAFVTARLAAGDTLALVREPTDRERARAAEIAARTLLALPPRPAGLDAELVATMTELVLDAAARNWDDDGWVDSGTEPTVSLQPILDRIRKG
jgi:hypothetical protein